MKTSAMVTTSLRDINHTPCAIGGRIARPADAMGTEGRIRAGLRWLG
jgi:hypothetical protein